MVEKDNKFSISWGADSVFSGAQTPLRRLSIGSGGGTEELKAWIQNQVDPRIKDESTVFSAYLILLATVVAFFCGVAAFTLHLVVGYAGCLGGANGCHEHVLLDLVEPLGIGPSAFFIISCSLSGLICSLIMYSPFRNGVARHCKGGGGGHTKILVASGTQASVWVVVFRIFLAAIYMGGGNPLGTEGPIIHLSVSLATWMVSMTGKRRRKFLSTFAVIGAAAGISAGFNVLVTGFVYVIEELTRTLSRKLALILAFAAAMAVLFKDYVEKLLELWIHPSHPALVPASATLEKMTDVEVQVGLALCVPIGLLTGVAGWIFTYCASSLLRFFNDAASGRRSSRLQKMFPERTHLAIVGCLCGCLGAIGYELSGMNAVWGTTIDAIPEALKRGICWEHLICLFVLKFIAFILATAAGGPGGLLVPSLVSGGLLALAVGRLVGASDELCAACAVIGMGSMFASVMHMPLTGVIIILELTRAEHLMLHVVIANFISSNVVARLPHGDTSFVHHCLEGDPTWLKLEERDFIETDKQEQATDAALFASLFLISDADRIVMVFHAWAAAVDQIRDETQLPERSASSKGDPLDDAESITPRSPASRITPPGCVIEVHARHDRRLPTSASLLSGRTDITGKPILQRMATSGNLLQRSISTGDCWTSEHRAVQVLCSPKARSSSDPDKVHAIMKRSATSGKLGLSRSSTAANLDDAEEAEKRKQQREQWEIVSRLIPGLNVRIWKSLDFHQRAALCAAVQNQTPAASPVHHGDEVASTAQGCAMQAFRNCERPQAGFPASGSPPPDPASLGCENV